jgi:hypothetical protein
MYPEDPWRPELVARRLDLWVLRHRHDEAGAGEPEISAVHSQVRTGRIRPEGYATWA